MYLFYCFSFTFAVIEDGKTTLYTFFFLRWTAALRVSIPLLLLSSPYLPFDPLKLLLLFVTFQTFTLTIVLCGSLHTAFALIIGGATQILPFHLQYFVVPSCMPLSRKRSVVCSRAYFRPLRVVVVVVSPLYHQEERPVKHFAVALIISMPSPVGGVLCLCCIVFF